MYSSRVSISSSWSRGLVESLCGRPGVFGDVFDKVGSVVFGDEWGVGLEVAPEEFVVDILVYDEGKVRDCPTTCDDCY